MITYPLTHAQKGLPPILRFRIKIMDTKRGEYYPQMKIFWWNLIFFSKSSAQKRSRPEYSSTPLPYKLNISKRVVTVSSLIFDKDE